MHFLQTIRGEMKGISNGPVLIMKVKQLQRRECCCGKPVSVIDYFRLRFGKWEFIKSDCRRLPKR